MPNIIEITVRAKTDDASFDAARQKAAATAAEADAALAGIGSGGGSAQTSIGADMASQIADQLHDGIQNEVPAAFHDLSTTLKPAAMSAGEESGSVFSSAFARVGSQFTDEQRAAALAWAKDLGAGARDAITEPLADVPKVSDKTGASSGVAFTKSFSAEMDKGLGSTAVLSTSLRTIGTEGDPVGKDFAVKFSQAARDGITASSVSAILAPSGPIATQIDADAKTVGEKAGKDSGDGMSKLIVAALVGAAAVGPAAILTGMAAATVGATALVLKSNVAIAADYQKVGADASAAIKAAAAPLTGDLNQALVGVDTSIKALTPDLKTAFAGAAPDIGVLTTGVMNLASNALPGVGAALNASQADVVGFANGLTPLGAGIGSFFTGITRDSAATGAGLQSALGVAGNAFGTLGTVVGSASSAISADLLAVDPVLNTVLSTFRAISSPATVGGIAGAFGAMKLDPSISSGLGSAATKLSTFAENSVDAEGGMSRLGSAAEGMSGALSKGASVMGGPWGIAIGAGIGLASGLVGSLIQAAHASDALTLSQQGLSDAVAQDGGNAGKATAAYIAQSDAANGLTQSAAAAGVSIQTWTSAVLGNKQAQGDVTTAVDKLNASQLNQMTTAAANANVTSRATGDLQGGTVTVLSHSQAVDKLTDSNQRLLSSMTAQAGQIASDITKQAQLTQATNALNSSTAIFNATLAAGYQTMVQSATTAGDNAVAALNLGDTQSGLNQKLAAGVTQYQLLTGAASGYQTILNSLNGSTMTADQAQNTLAQDMLNARTSFKQNGESLDLNTQAGINNRQSLTQAAQAIQALGIANINSGGNINTANAIIQAQATAFVNTTGATGKAKTAIEQYLSQIDQIPASKTTTIYGDIAPAQQALRNILTQVDNSAGTIHINMGTVKGSGQTHAYGGVMSAAATGGAQSNWTQINERGQEAAYLPTGTIVMPHANTEAMLASGGGNGVVQLEFIGGPSDQLGEAIWTWLKANIKVRGGRGAGAVDRALAIN